MQFSYCCNRKTHKRVKLTAMVYMYLNKRKTMTIRKMKLIKVPRNTRNNKKIMNLRSLMMNKSQKERKVKSLKTLKNKGREKN